MFRPDDTPAEGPLTAGSAVGLARCERVCYTVIILHMVGAEGPRAAGRDSGGKSGAEPPFVLTYLIHRLVQCAAGLMSSK